MKKERVAVIDADILLYKACRVAEEEVNWGDDQWVLWSDLNKVKTIIDDQVDLIVEEMEGDRSILCFSDKKIIEKKLILSIKLTDEEEENLYVFKEHYNTVRILILSVCLLL